MKNVFDKLQVIIVSAVLLTVSVLIFIIPDKTFSENENRSLETAPKLSAETMVSGEFTETLGRYLADQFPFRDTFVSVKAYGELLSGKKENNGVIYCDGDTLVPRTDINPNRLYDNLKCISDFSKRTGAEVTVAALPRVADVYSELLPVGYPKDIDRDIWKNYADAAKALRVNTADVYDVLCESNSYYRTDHHYTTDGAFKTYEILASVLGFEPFDIDYFKISRVTESFCGTSMRTSGFYFAEKDEIYLYRYPSDDRYKIVADGEEIELYDMEKLDTTDKYAVFLGGNHARVDIALESEDREKLLIIRDSFADSIAPFLALHYNLTLIDLRYYTDSVSRCVREEGIDKVLVLENISELVTAKNLTYLRME
ncbi:MAG: hypothetical protein IJW27_08210 [Clostridia bacterium]|nr:hypothetical protein [Clostridia bacterium]